MLDYHRLRVEHVSGVRGPPGDLPRDRVLRLRYRHCRIEAAGRRLADGEQLARDYDADSVLMRIEDLQDQGRHAALVAATDPRPGGAGRARGHFGSHRLMRRAATTQAPVLFIGESGVGKGAHGA